MSIRFFSSARSRRRVARDLFALAVVLGAVALAVRAYAPPLADPAWLREFVAGFGPWAPAAFVAVQAVQVVAAPIPGQVVSFVGGYLFGTVRGAALSLLGVGIGSYLAFALAGRYGRPYVERMVAPETVARFDAITEERALGSLFVAFLIPGLPDDAICFVAGLTAIDRWKLVVVAAVGRTPGFVVATAAGSSLAREETVLAVGLAVLLVALSVVGYALRGRILGGLGGDAAAAAEGDDRPA